LTALAQQTTPITLQSAPKSGRGAQGSFVEVVGSQLLSLGGIAMEYFPTASAAIQRLPNAGVLQESSGKPWGRLFLYWKYPEILNREC
jgi:hypothetical protein